MQNNSTGDCIHDDDQQGNTTIVGTARWLADKKGKVLHEKQ